MLSDGTGEPEEAPTGSVTATARGQSVGRKPHPGHTCSATSSTPFGALGLERRQTYGLSDCPLEQRPAGWEPQGSLSVFTEISAWPFPSIVSCPSGLLKQCVSYRFCLPALTSLFCPNKQTVNIYRSMRLTKRNLRPGLWAALSHRLPEPADLGWSSPCK